MNRQQNTVILKDYESKRDLLEDYAQEVQSIIEDILEVNSIHFHSVSCRVKEKDSLAKKINKLGKSYQSLEDVTDVVGFRIITYFSEDVDIVADIINSEFVIDNQNSIDKRASLDPDRFGYLSLHYIIELPEQRLQLTEYRKFSKIKAEIQIRSILQHTWAEIEHDLGYKVKEQIPYEFRRSFSRIAGLLEVADLEFARLRSELADFEKNFALLLQESPYTININEVSLQQFLKIDPTINKIEEEHFNISFDDYVLDDIVLRSLVDQLHYLGIKNIGQLNDYLEQYKDFINIFVQYTHPKEIHLKPLGVSLQYLCIILIAKTQSLDKVIDFINGYSNPLFNNTENFEGEARKLIDLFNQYSKSILKQ
ncbi:hypothetical protein EJF36_06650 [Bacillus sp. HMF5848]|uniref:GTP pyrophosphokinase n=1 Tax=Bacillus sp. HMF5848 TaxID=2495421 RepID=UPI000F79DAF7|nr:hypothetical protein [Bacillus sp. HMF5848]RSK26565.1 hypothetical protein EJF36_06650 [Bacillus sp. HMF5848]